MVRFAIESSWALTITAMVFLLIFVTSVTARLKNKGLRILILYLAVVVLGGLMAFPIWGAWFLKHKMELSPNYFVESIAGMAFFVAAVILVIVRGRTVRSGFPPVASGWRIWRNGVCFIISALLAIGTLFGLDRWLAHRVEDEWRDADRRVKALLARAQPSSGKWENGASLYVKAFAGLDGVNFDTVENSPFGSARTFDPDQKATLDFLQLQKETIALLRQAASLRNCEFDPEQWPDDPTGPRNPFIRSRLAAYLLELDANQQLARGDIDDAFADVNALRGLARALASRPILIASAVSLTIESQSDSVLERTLGLTQSQKGIPELVTPPSYALAFEYGICGDERWSLGVIKGLFAGDPAANQDAYSHWRVPGVISRTFMYADSDNFVSWMKQVETWPRRPFFEAKPEMAAAFQPRRDAGLVANLFSVNPMHILERQAQVEAADSCAGVAIAMTRFRLEHGALPTKLQELLPKYLTVIPIDPFDGKPLKMAARGDSRIVYSIGPDMIDNGGMPLAGKAGDIAFTVKMPGP